MDDTNALQSIGIMLPTPVDLLSTIGFGILYCATYRFCKKTGWPTTTWQGIVLRLIFRAVHDISLLYSAGTSLYLYRGRVSRW